MIDPQLRAAGWNIVSFSPSRALDRKPLAVEEFPTANGPADYALVLDGQVVGVVEAKKLTPYLGDPLANGANDLRG